MSKDRADIKFGVISAIESTAIENIEQSAFPLQYDKLQEICTIALNTLKDPTYAASSTDKRIKDAAIELNGAIKQTIEFYQEPQKISPEELSPLICGYLEEKVKSYSSKSIEIEHLAQIKDQAKLISEIEAKAKELALGEVPAIRSRLEPLKHTHTSDEFDKIYNAELEIIKAASKHNYLVAVKLLQNPDDSENLLKQYHEEIKKTENQLTEKLRQEQEALRQTRSSMNAFPAFVTNGQLMTVSQYSNFGYPEVELYQHHYEANPENLRKFFDAIKKPYLADPDLAFKKLSEIKSDKIASFITDSAIRLLEQQVITVDDIDGAKCFSHPRIAEATLNSMIKNNSLIFAKQIFAAVKELEFTLLEDEGREESIKSAINLTQNKVREVKTSALYIKTNEELMLAIRCQDLNSVNAAIDAGADINYFNDQGQTVLMFAATSENNTKIVEDLLGNSGVSDEHINAKDKDGQTALMYAAINKDAKSAEVLLGELRVSDDHINAKDKDGKTALMYAIERRGAIYPSSYALLKNPRVSLEHINAKDKDGKTALMYAVESGRDDLVDALLRNPRVSLEHINAWSDDGYTALMYAARSGNVDITEALLKNPRVSLEHINAKSIGGSSAFNIADSKGAYGIAEELIFGGAELEFKDKIKYKATIDQYEKFSKAVTTGSIKFVDSMADPQLANCRINGKESALHYAITHNLEDVAVSLIKNGADTYQESIYGNTPLMLASSKGQQKIVDVILDSIDTNYPWHVNKKNPQGQTALYLAVMAGHMEIADKLLSKDARPDLETKRGENADDVAIAKGYIDKHTAGLKAWHYNKNGGGHQR